MKKSHWLIILLAIVSITCSKEDPQPVRTFYLGFTPFPYDISLEAVNYSYQRITADGDMITHHFDNGVPWVEALGKETYSDNILNDWAFRKTNTPAGHK